MIWIQNVIRQCHDGNVRYRQPGKLERVAFHRARLNDRAVSETQGIHLAKAFMDTRPGKAGSYTGGENPYTFYVHSDGNVQQAIPVKELGPHARRWNSTALGIAAIGDFRREKPPVAQWYTAVNLCALWSAYGLIIHGHDELPGGSSDSTKECPGRLWDMDKFRSEVSYMTKQIGNDAVGMMARAGIIFGG